MYQDNEGCVRRFYCCLILFLSTCSRWRENRRSLGWVADFGVGCSRPFKQKKLSFWSSGGEGMEQHVALRSQRQTIWKQKNKSDKKSGWHPTLFCLLACSVSPKQQRGGSAGNGILFFCGATVSLDWHLLPTLGHLVPTPGH
jgi:hypothetical protein